MRIDVSTNGRTLTLVAAASAVLGALLTATAVADANGAFKRLDQDSNGWLTYDELKQEKTLQALFADADLDRNGLLSPLEFEGLLALPGAAPAPM